MIIGKKFMKTKLVLFLKKNKEIIGLSISYSILWVIFYFKNLIEKGYCNLFQESMPNNYIFWGFVIILLIINFFYLYFYKKTHKISFKKILILSIFINLLLSLIWPIATTDIFDYVYNGRILAVFHTSPYLSVYNNFSFDQFYYLLKTMWTFRPTPYGPIFIFISSFFSTIFQNNVLLNIFSLKIFLAIINIINGFLIYKITKNKICFYLYAFNPLILFELALNSHNDSLIIMFVLLSFLFFKKATEQIKDREKIKKYLLSFIFLTFSILTKFISLIFVPFFAIISLHNINKLSNKIKLIFLYFITFIILSFILYKPLVHNLYDIIRPIIDQSKLYGFYSPLVPILALFILPITNNPIAVSAIINKIIFIILSIIFFLKVLLKKSPFKKGAHFNNYCLGSVIILSLFYATSLSWILPWYFILLLVLILLNFNKEESKTKFYIYSFFSITVFGILYYIILR